MNDFLLCLLMLWIGGIIGGATIAVGSGQNKGWTFAGGLAVLSVWPLLLGAIGLYLCFGAKMDSCDP